MASKYSLTVFAFCLMPNHIHLLIRPQHENLYDATRDLFSRCAMRFNRKYGRRGHLFGAPYRQSICLDDSYLLAASLYIHLNPVRTALVQDPLQYRWSSCQLYCSDNAPESFVNPNFVLSLLNDTESESRATYRQLMEKGIELAKAEILEQEDAIDQFRSSLALALPSLFKWLARTQQVAKASGLNLLAIEDLERRIEDLRKKRFRSRPETKKAKKFLIEQLMSRSFTITEIAEKLGVSRKTVYNLLKA